MNPALPQEEKKDWIKIFKEHGSNLARLKSKLGIAKKGRAG